MNLLCIPARDAYAYGLCLLDALFSKQELASSLFFKSKKSEKPGLDRKTVDKLLGKYVIIEGVAVEYFCSLFNDHIPDALLLIDFSPLSSCLCSMY